jgi:hypothetical protein
VPGEPSPELFDVGDDLEESAPSAFAMKIAARPHGKVSVAKFAEEDRGYYLRRP